MTVSLDSSGSPRDANSGLVLLPGDGHEFGIGAMRVIVKEAGTHTDGRVVIAEMSVPAGAGSPPAHIHRRGAESWYLLEGELELRVGTSGGRYGPGSFVMIPAGTPHQFANPGSVPARFLLTMTPHQMQMLEAMSRVWAAGPPDLAAIAEVFARYDSELIRPR